MIATFPETGIAPVVIGAGTLLLKVANWATVIWLGYDIVGAFTESDAEAVASEMPGGAAGECAQKWGEGEIPALSPSARVYHAAQLENWRPYAANKLEGNPIALAAANATINKTVELIASGDSPDGAPVTLCDVQAAALIIVRQVDKSADPQDAPGPEAPPLPGEDAPAGRTSPWIWGALAAAVAASSWWLWRRSR